MSLPNGFCLHCNFSEIVLGEDPEITCLPAWGCPNSKSCPRHEEYKKFKKERGFHA